MDVIVKFIPGTVNEKLTPIYTLRGDILNATSMSTTLLKTLGITTYTNLLLTKKNGIVSDDSTNIVDYSCLYPCVFLNSDNKLLTYISNTSNMTWTVSNNNVTVTNTSKLTTTMSTSALPATSINSTLTGYNTGTTTITTEILMNGKTTLSFYIKVIDTSTTNNPNLIITDGDNITIIKLLSTRNIKDSIVQFINNDTKITNVGYCVEQIDNWYKVVYHTTSSNPSINMLITNESESDINSSIENVNNNITNINYPSFTINSKSSIILCGACCSDTNGLFPLSKEETTVSTYSETVLKPTNTSNTLEYNTVVVRVTLPISLSKDTAKEITILPDTTSGLQCKVISYWWYDKVDFSIKIYRNINVYINNTLIGSTVIDNADFCSSITISKDSDNLYIKENTSPYVEKISYTNNIKLTVEPIITFSKSDSIYLHSLEYYPVTVSRESDIDFLNGYFSTFVSSKRVL